MEKAREWARTKEGQKRDQQLGLATSADQHTAEEMIDRYIRTILPRKSLKKKFLSHQRAQLSWWKKTPGRHQAIAPHACAYVRMPR